MEIKYQIFEEMIKTVMMEGGYASDYKPTETTIHYMEPQDELIFDTEKEAEKNLKSLDRTGRFTILKIYIK